MRNSQKQSLTASLLLWCLAWSPLGLAQIEQIGVYRDWDAYVLQEGNSRICYMLSVPTDMEPKNVRRGEVYFLVTHRPADNIRDEVSVITGYTYAPDSTVTARIDRNEYELFTRDDGAWLREPGDESRMVQAMKRGERMIVVGNSNRGTRTTDTYSLFGFTAAHNAISERCAR